MKYEIRPFVMLDDIEGIYEFARENPSPVQFRVDTIRIGYPIVNYSVENHRDFPTLDGKPALSTAQLLLEINRRLNIECDKGNNYAPHEKTDYCIEVVTIKDNVADVSVGS